MHSTPSFLIVLSIPPLLLPSLELTFYCIIIIRSQLEIAACKLLQKYVVFASASSLGAQKFSMESLMNRKRCPSIQQVFTDWLYSNRELLCCFEIILVAMFPVLCDDPVRPPNIVTILKSFLSLACTTCFCNLKIMSVQINLLGGLCQLWFSVLTFQKTISMNTFGWQDQIGNVLAPLVSSHYNSNYLVAISTMFAGLSIVLLIITITVFIEMNCQSIARPPAKGTASGTLLGRSVPLDVSDMGNMSQC